MTLTVVGVAAPSAGATPTPWYYAQFNMWGNVGWSGALDPAQYVFYYTLYQQAAGRGPAGLSLNEVCASNAVSQFDYMAGNMAPYGYYGLMQINKLVTNKPNCTRYGNAVFSFATAAPNPINNYFVTLLPNAPNENRGLVCMTATVFTAVQTVCSSHLDSGGGTITKQQMAAADLFELTYDLIHPGAAHYWGGDFNLGWSTVVNNVPSPYSGRREANQGISPILLTHNMRTELLQKFDYSFGRAAQFYANSIVRHDSSAYSDHALIEGVFFTP